MNRLLLFAALAVIGSGSMTVPAVAAPGVTHRYLVRVTEDLSRLEVTARMEGEVGRLRASREAGKLLLTAAGCEGQLLARSGRSLRIPPGVRCIEYGFDLAAAQTLRQRRWSGPLATATPADWLWLPSLSSDAQVRVRFQLPAGMNVSVPWQAVGDDYLVGAEAGGGNAVSAFGRFSLQPVPVPGAVLRVALLPGASGAPDGQVMARWLAEAARGVALVYGRFPHPAPQVLVVPSGPSRWGGEAAVPFGRVVRDGGESVHFFVDTPRPLEDYVADWTATHEFSHLLVPFLRDRWLSEGLASYYQNVLMVRAGHYSPVEGWSKLHAGIERARATRPAVSPAESGRDGVMGGHRMMIYWSGAALLLLADVRLRLESEGAESLDVLLGRLQHCCLPSEQSWSAEQLFARLDSLSSHAIFQPLNRRYAHRPGVPPLAETYRLLGLEVVSNTELRLLDEAPAADLRNALMGQAHTSLESRTPVADTDGSSSDR